MIAYLTTGSAPRSSVMHKLLLDRKVVMKLHGKWYVQDLLVWRRLLRKPRIDFDATQRWFGYSAQTMERARTEARR